MGKRILYVDDDINMLNTAEQILVDEGYEVSLAKSGDQAIKLLQKNKNVTLILLDVDMPQKDGYDTFSEIRAIEGLEKVPVIFLTGMDAPDFEIKGLKLGAADYITKPFLKDVLLARIENCIARFCEPESQTTFNEAELEKLALVLSPTEITIAKLVAEGYSNQEIADKSHYSYGYVRKVVSLILDKLYLSSRIELRRLLRKE